VKQILLTIDDHLARDLERVAPMGKRSRTEFIRLALRRALDLALEDITELAYRKKPMPAGLTAADMEGWDPDNRLAKPAGASARPGKSRPSQELTTVGHAGTVVFAAAKAGGGPRL
jgi:hypothetical protein